MRHRLLDDTTPDTNAAHQAPVAVNLPVLLANRVAQVHAPSKPPPQRKKIPEVVTTRSNHPPKPSKPLIRLAPCRAKSQKPSPNCASWANGLPCVSTPSRLNASPIARPQAARNRNAGVTASIVAFGVIRLDAPAMSARHDGPAILPTPLAAWARPTPRALSRTGKISAE